MITVESSMHVEGIRAESVIAFFQQPDDELYRRWWPGTHLAMHPVNDAVGVGQIVFMDEYVGSRRLSFDCLVTELGRDRIVWRFRRRIDLPCWLTLRIADDESGATITHTIRAGFEGAVGHAIDPLLRLYFSRRFEAMMDEHFRHEFSILPALIAEASATQTLPARHPAGM